VAEKDDVFRDFVRARHQSLLRTALLLTGDAHEAEDLVQEALVRTYAAWWGIREVGAVEGYVRTTMARHVVRSRQRRFRERPVSEVGDWTASAPDQADVMTVREALRLLPAPQRAAIVLRFYTGLTEREVAEVLRCSVGTVKSRVARGTARLREQLSPASTRRAGDL